jgi:drug/metabolite transporter (DMT)-like permease
MKRFLPHLIAFFVVATNYVYFYPVTTIVFAWLVLNEQITTWFIIGTTLILYGMYLVNSKRPKLSA